MKLFMMPHTVPNRPTNGAVAPIVARTPVPRAIARPAPASSRSSRETVRSLTPSLAGAGGRKLVWAWASAVQDPLARPAGGSLFQAWRRAAPPGRRVPPAGRQQLDPLGERHGPGQHGPVRRSRSSRPSPHCRSCPRQRGLVAMSSCRSDQGWCRGSHRLGAGQDEEGAAFSQLRHFSAMAVQPSLRSREPGQQFSRMTTIRVTPLPAQHDQEREGHRTDSGLC